MKKSLIFMLALFCGLSTSARERQLFDKGWLFTLADSAGMQEKSYADLAWPPLDLPHDWAIEGDFLPTNPAGASGGALPGGIGWYRKHFTVNPKEKYDRYVIGFDGVYMNATVYLNGHKLGNRPYGYSSFEYDLTPYIDKKGDNVIAVKVDNSDQPNSRWYSGCGIYRHVWLTKTSNIYINQWGQYVSTTPDGKVKVHIDWHGQAHPTFRNTVYDAMGKVVASNMSDKAEQTLQVPNPMLWSIATPYLYTVKTELMVGKKTMDAVTTTTGFRNARFDAQKGFFLNGESLKINGVCELTT